MPIMVFTAPRGRFTELLKRVEGMTERALFDLKLANDGASYDGVFEVIKHLNAARRSLNDALKSLAKCKRAYLDWQESQEQKTA